MAYKIPYTFVPGTKAKANEVNSNFSKVAEYFTELNTSLSSTSTDVQELEIELEETKQLLLEGRTKFCVNSAESTLLTTASKLVYFNSQFVVTNYKGVTATIKGVSSIDCSSFANGVHNIFITLDGTTLHYKNKITVQAIQPTGNSVDDVWLNTSKEPIFAGKWNGSDWDEFLAVPVGSVLIENNTITKLTIFPFNQNGYNINGNSDAGNGSLANLTSKGTNVIASNAICDYSRGQSISWNTLYCATFDGYLFARGYLNNNKNYSVQIGTTEALGITVAYSYLTDTGNTLQMVVPIPKGYYYKVTGSGSDSCTIFYPMKGAI